MKVIIGAQKEEIESIKDLFTDIEEKEYLTIKYLQGKIHNQDYQRLLNLELRRRC